ncbi:hypothetical protein ACHAWF_011539 [Thalassiosira exigua]
MSPKSRWGACTLARYESTASELNGKFESDYNNCLETLEVEKKKEPAVDDASITSVPRVISWAQKDEQTEILLRTKSSRSTTTQNIFLASSQDGIIVTSSRQVLQRDKAQSSADSATNASTLPTFMSVGSADHLQNNDLKDNTVFLVTREGTERPPLLTVVSREAKSRMSKSGRESPQDKETRKRLHYREKLHLLTSRLTTSSAVERSKEMIANIVERGRDIGKDTVNGGGNETGDKAGDDNIFHGLKSKLYACSMRLCADEAVVDHEGLVIAFPAKNFSCRCNEETYSIGENGSKFTEVSSITGLTNQRFQRRRWIF